MRAAARRRSMLVPVGVTVTVVHEAAIARVDAETRRACLIGHQYSSVRDADLPNVREYTVTHKRSTRN